MNKLELQKLANDQLHTEFDGIYCEATKENYDSLLRLGFTEWGIMHKLENEDIYTIDVEEDQFQFVALSTSMAVGNYLKFEINDVPTIKMDVEEAKEILYSVYDVYSSHVVNAFYILCDKNQDKANEMTVDLAMKISTK